MLRGWRAAARLHGAVELRHVWFGCSIVPGLTASAATAATTVIVAAHAAARRHNSKAARRPAPDSAFNEVDGIAGGMYAGSQPQKSTNGMSVSEYDVACFQVSQH